jgi:outer membrane protein assembly factor BamB
VPWLGPSHPSVLWSLLPTVGVQVSSAPAQGAEGDWFLVRNLSTLDTLSSMATVKASTVVSSKDSAFVAVAADGTRYVGSWFGLRALDPSGNVLWSRDHAGASPSLGEVIESYAEVGAPTVGDDGTIYVASWPGLLIASRPDGTTRWTLDLNDTVSGFPAIAADGTLYVGG